MFPVKKLFLLLSAVVATTTAFAPTTVIKQLNAAKHAGNALAYAKTQDAIQPPSIPSSHDKIYRNQKANEKLSKFDVAWNEKYAELIEFHAQNQHSNVPSSHPNKKLFRWVTNQRSQWKNKKNSLTPARIQKLNDLKFSWCNRSSWEKRFDELKSYHSTHGHSRVPINDEQYVELGRFVASQRHQFKLLSKGKKSTLSSDRIHALSSVDFIFDMSHLAEEAWAGRYEELMQFFNETGHSTVPIKHDLWRWCDSQRISYRQTSRGQSSTMTKERIEKLDSLNFLWNPREAQWDHRLEELKQHKEVHGHVNVNSKHYPQLSSWLQTQRSSINLAVEKMEALKKVGVKFGTQEIGVISKSPQHSKKMVKMRDEIVFDRKPLFRRAELNKLRQLQRVIRDRSIEESKRLQFEEDSARVLMNHYTSLSQWG